MDDFNAVADFFVHLVVYGFSNDFNRATSIVHGGALTWGIIPRSKFEERRWLNKTSVPMECNAETGKALESAFLGIRRER